MSDKKQKSIPQTVPVQSATFSQSVNSEIRRAAATGIYDIRGGGAKRKVPHFDDLLFLGASISRYPLEGYREKCETKVTLGTRFAKNPIEIDIPITIAGMSFGSLSGGAKEALGRGASMAGTSTTTGDGGMTVEERGHSSKLVYQYLPSRYGMNPDDLRKADAIEVVVGQGAKPGGGGMLLGQKISDRVAQMRNLPKGIDQRSACRHPDWTGPDDLEIKILELREITGWRVPIYIKVGGARPYFDTTLAVKAGADVVVLDGMQGGTAATQDVFIEHVGQPILACIREAVRALQDLDMHREVQLIVSGGVRNGADVAKCMALGADAVSIGSAALIALGDNDPRWEASQRGSLSPSAINAALPIDTASAPSAIHFATSAPLRTPPDTINCTSRCISRSCKARTASRIQARMGCPTCSINTSCVAAVPPCIPSSTTTSAPALTANVVSK